ncbi:hypothetical protein AB6A40_009661 [Gnathostoma spinigerum]|uniref:Uncharacterized protein n=1 Tax=Gnathostoma spinigerum TaxID=75299 RepID=A0ABD6F122_9BILA
MHLAAIQNIRFVHKSHYAPKHPPNEIHRMATPLRTTTNGSTSDDGEGYILMLDVFCHLPQSKQYHFMNVELTPSSPSNSLHPLFINPCNELNYAFRHNDEYCSERNELPSDRCNEKRSDRTVCAHPRHTSFTTQRRYAL